MEPLIKISNLKKIYDGKTIVDIEKLDFYEDRIYFILGENGAGKSTLLNMITDIEEQSSGTIEKSRKCNIGYLPQKSYIFDMSVYKNIQLAVKDESKIIELLKKFELEHLQYSNGKKLSGGEKQRISLLRVIGNEHRVLILDEPTSALDIHACRLIESAIKSYKNETKCCVIVTTHDVALAKRMADEIILMSNGNIIVQGEFKRVFAEIDNRYVREFLEYFEI